jgi:hypothetical protein
MAATADNAMLRLDFLPTKAESTLETCAMLGLKRVASDDEVVMAAQRLAATWQRHQLVPPTPTPAMRYHAHRSFKARRRRRDIFREAVSGVVGKVVSHMQSRGRASPRSSTPSPAAMAATAAKAIPDMTKPELADTSSTSSAETNPDCHEDLRWWNLLVPESP